MARSPAVRLFPILATLTLAAVAAGVFVFSGRAEECFSRRRAAKVDFPALLAALDARIAAVPQAPAGSGDAAVKKIDEEIEAALAAAEERALSVEAGLSVLKRRRALAGRAPRLRSSYAEAAVRLTGRFPHSESASALAAEALLGEGKTMSAAAYAESLTEPRFLPIKAAVLAASGALSDPASLPADSDLMLFAASEAYAASADTASADTASADTAGTDASGYGPAARALVVNGVLARLLGGEGRSALAVLKERLGSSSVPTGNALRLQAELEYDFGDPRTAASLFSLEDEAVSALRRADAAMYASDLPQAREAWKTVVSASSDPHLIGIALYDLAATSSRRTDTGAAEPETTEEEGEEERSYLERLLALDAAHTAASIRLSRLHPGDDGDRILDAAAAVKNDGLLDLERIRRSAVRDGPSRTIAKLWLLMNARGDDLRVYRWAAYYMETYGAYEDVRHVVEEVGRKGDDAPWIDFHVALAAGREGRLDVAEAGFTRAANTDDDWRLAANLAAVAEAKLEMKTALERYEIAASLASDPRDLSALQFRVARCLASLGKETDARRVLAYAVDLDPENRRARLELKRLEGR